MPAAPSAAPPPRSAIHVSGPTAATRTATSEQPRPRAGKPAAQGSCFRQRAWVYPGVAAGFLILVAVWLGTKPGPNTPQRVYARTPTSDEGTRGAVAETT